MFSTWCHNDYTTSLVSSRSFQDNSDLQVFAFDVNIRTNEEVAFIQSAALDMGLQVKAFSETVRIYGFF